LFLTSAFAASWLLCHEFFASTSLFLPREPLMIARWVRVVGLVLLLATTTFAGRASAVIVVYDLRLDFSNANNPNGPWEYLKGNVPLTHFSPVTQPALPAAAANGYWGDTSSSNNSAIMLTTAGGSATGLWTDNDFLKDDVLVRTTDPSTGAPMIITWTAPSAGSFTYSGMLWNANAPLGPGATSYAMTLNAGPALESGTAMPGNDRTNGISMLNGLIPVNVLPGDVVALEFNPAPGPPFGSLAGITFTIDFTPVPEPSSLALASLGLFAMTGYALRRRKQSKSADKP
jgi:hypothetical protein